MTAFTRKITLAAALSAAIIPAIALGQEVGITAVVRNDVKVTTPANPTLHKAKPRERIALGNDIVTGGSSMTQLLLLDKTSFTVGANARVRIDRFVYDPARNASSVSTSVAKGAFRFMSGRGLKKGGEGSSIKTPVASIGIRGTIVEGVVGEEAIAIARREGVIDRNTTADPETASLIVLRGPGRNAQGVQRGAIDVTVGDQVIPLEDAGMALFIPGPGQAPIGPFLLSQRGIVSLRDLLGVRPIPGRERTFERDPTTDQQFGCDGGGESGAGGCSVFYQPG
ncbi:MAG: FecR domain-containing protein [Porphyrobacter sp.]|nr:FecR domain-containing protein [Porphyrobacter sp.]